MGLKEVFQNGADSIINAFGNVATTATYHSIGTFAYNATTGGQTESGGSDISIKYISDLIRSEEIQDRDVRMTDRKLLVANTDISVTPKVGDYATLSSKRYNVVDWITDPASALYEIYVREN